MRQLISRCFGQSRAPRRADIVIDEQAGLNVIGFETGFGDGVYPLYFGLDRDGEPLVLLTNFEIIDGTAGS